VAANIECDVMKSLRRASLRERRAAVAQDGLAAAVAPFLTDLEAVEPGFEDRERLSLGDFVRPGPEAAVPAGPAEIEAAKKAVQPFFEASSVSAGDRFLILGVHLYQRTLGELAEELGISREAAKKRHLRAVTRLRVARSKAEEDDCDRTDVPSGQERDVFSQAGSCTRAGRVGAATGDDR
jgi:DNA-directed RNA polymerase specialized sigma24 family protein